MKQFIVDRHTTPNTPTLEQVPTEKIPVYEDMAAAAADLANLAENQIIATHDTGSELSAPVDVVQSGNMHAVTSNAVAVNCPRFPDYANRITIASETTSWTATEDCYVMIIQISTSAIPNVTINNKEVGVTDSFGGSTYIMSFAGYVKKGQTIAYAFLYNSSLVKIFKLI